MDKKESFYWDLVKGAAVLLMLWGHCIQYCALDAVVYITDSAYQTIYAFHMPVFMLISGYLFYYSFRKRNMADLIEHRIRGMLHPIVMATFLNNVLMLILSYALSGRGDFLFGSLFAGIANDLWFLWAVLYCSVIVGVCCKLTEKLSLQLLLLVLGIFVILLLPQWNMTLFMYPYFVAGFLCARYRQSAKRLYRVIRYAMLVLFPVMMHFYQVKHFIYVTPIISEELALSESLSIAGFRWAIGFAGSIWMLTIMEFLLALGSRIAAVQKCLQGVSCLGRNSLQIYCLSASMLSGYSPYLYRKFVDLVGYNVFAQNVTVFSFLFTPILATAWSVILYGIVLLMRKFRLHGLIFGR